MKRTEHGVEFSWVRVGLSGKPEPARGELSVGEVLISEAPDFDLHQAREFATEVFDVHSRTTIDGRRIFISEEQRFHRFLKTRFYYDAIT